MNPLRVLESVLSPASLIGLSKLDLIDIIESQADVIGQLERRLSLIEVQVTPRRPAKGRSPAEWDFRVRGFEWLDTEIQPRSEPNPKTIRVLRVYVPLEDQPDGPGYWDVTGKRVQAMLSPLLEQLTGTDTRVYFRQDGRGPQSTYSLRIAPPAAPQS